jgi:GNAT superfamily N-acetyltransferase
MAEVTLRAAGTADAPAITEVFLGARRGMTYLPHLHTDDETARFIFDLVRQAQVQVAVRDGAIVGFAAVRASWLEHLNVHPRAQNAGIGSRLIQWAKQTSPTGLDLWVFQRNTRARALYAAHGWRVVLQTDGDNEEGQPDVRMQWEPGRDTRQRG